MWRLLIVSAMRLPNVSTTNSMTAFVTPKSKKSHNRFCNLMNRNSECIVEQHKGDKVFLTSANGKNHFWVNLAADVDWNIKLN